MKVYGITAQSPRLTKRGAAYLAALLSFFSAPILIGIEWLLA